MPASPGRWLGGALTDSLSWRGIFWINLPLGALAWVLSNRALRVLPPHAASGQKIDYLGAALLTAAISAWLVLSSSGGRDFAWDSSVALFLLVAGLVFSGLTAWVEHRAPAPMLPLHLFANGTVLGGLLLAATNALCTFGASLLLPLYFQYIKHSSAALSGLLTTPFLLAFVVLSYAGGKISRALGRTKPTMLVAVAACAIGLGLLATMRAATPVVLCEIYSVLLGGGIGLVQPNITVAIQNAAERRDVGVATGSMLLFRAIGGAFGATLAGVMLLRYGFGAGFGACAVVAVAIGGDCRGDAGCGVAAGLEFQASAAPSRRMAWAAGLMALPSCRTRPGRRTSGAFEPRRAARRIIFACTPARGQSGVRVMAP